MYYKHIDGLRCLAVMAVVCMHLGIAGFAGGYVGVDIFFVISGFLITGLIVRDLENDNKFSLVRFYSRRALRILPALFFILLCSYIAAIFVLDSPKFAAFGKSMTAASFALSNVYFALQGGYFNYFSQSSPLLHTWSLGVEEQFYFIWPFLLMLCYRLKPVYKKPAIYLLLAIIFLLSLALSIRLQAHSFSYYLMPMRSYEFCIGGGLVFLMRWIKRLSNFTLEVLTFLGLALIVYSIFTYDATLLFPSYYALCPALGAALLIAGGSCRYIGSVFRLKPIVFIGLISYSLYLVHWPLIVYVKTLRQLLGYGYSLSELWICIILISSIIFAYMMYCMVEQPFRARASKVKSKQIKVLVYAFICSVVVACLGLLTLMYPLWSWRSHSATISSQRFSVRDWGGKGFRGGMIYHGKAKDPKLVVMGDSHAGMLDKGLVDYIGKPYHISIYTANGGGAGKYNSELTLPGLVRLTKRRQKTFDISNEQEMQDALSMLRRSESSVLLVSYDFAAQISKAGYLSSHKSLNINPAVDKDYAQYAPVVASLDKLRAEMGHRKLIIIGDVPAASDNPINCLGLPKWFKSAEKRCASSDPRYKNKAAIHVNHILQLYAKQHNNVYFLNPYDVLCTTEKCMNIDAKGEPIYADGHHLSERGSRFLLAKEQGNILNIIEGG